MSKRGPYARPAGPHHIPLPVARRLVGWNLSQLARAAQCGISTLYDLERGDIKEPSYVVVMRIVGAFREKGLYVYPDDLFPVGSSSDDDTTPAPPPVEASA